MRKHLQIKAWILLLVFISEILLPANLFALTSGPSQPEMSGFTPAGTTEMVNSFSGDFTYNIPLMDVEGYPVNIAYSSGVTMEQEASWVGLGWNLNVGTINRSVRGLPDDFKGDKIKTTTKIKPMKITKVGVGAGIELFGKGNPPLQPSPFTGNFGLAMMYNNYKGLGLSIDASMGARLDIGGKDLAGINGSVGLNLNSLDGASINSSLGASIGTKLGDNGKLDFGGSLGTGYNTRTGQTMLTLGTTAGYSNSINDARYKGDMSAESVGGGSSAGASATYLPIGLDTYTPYPTLKMQSNSMSFSATVGGEIWGLNLSGTLTGSQSEQSLISNTNDANAYGYLYAEEGSDRDLSDFNRDKTVELNATTRNLSPVNFTYDVFSVQGQGVGGMFRPFRNDIGNLHDPAYEYKEKSPDSQSFGAELGLGAYAKGGINYNTIDMNSIYGPWRGGSHARFKFKSNTVGSQFEKVYWKAAGELTESNLEHYAAIGGDKAMAFELQGMNTKNSMKDENETRGLSLISQKGEGQREARAKLLSVLTAEEAQYAALDKQIYSYSGNFYNGSISTTPINRIDQSGTIYRKAHHLSEITQINPDGERFVFGIPAYNNFKSDFTYNTNQSPLGNNPNKVAYNSSEASLANNKGKDHYFSKQETPAYAHSFLLTSKQSHDYQDVTGDGVSADDAGNAWKFNYQRTSENFKWRMPYSGANYSEGFKSDGGLDDKASFSYGEKELWYLHTVESKNQVAEFKILPREDNLSSAGVAGGPAVSGANTTSYLLDEIVLYNKYDRLKNGANATPIKKVRFEYDYSLCPGVENQLNLGGNDKGTGKLTLKKIFISYGNSTIGELSPYVFDYTLGNAANNPSYQDAASDRWGNYKPKSANPSSMENADFPYALQENNNSDVWAAAWNMREIIMPSGGKISITYEADDYAYVQNKDAMQMFSVVGAGNSTSFTQSTNLYDRNYLFINRPASTLGASQAELREMFLGERGRIDNMYFKFLTKVRSGVPYEYAAGYVTAEDIGVSSNPNYLWVKIANDSPHAITKTAWAYFRQNLFEVLYKQPNLNDNGLESILKGLAANVTDIKQMFTGVEKHLKSKNVANNFTANRSFIRLNHPSKFKKGGGSRVQQIVMNDSWQTMSGEGENSSYGQKYEYTTVDKNGNTISSGVATYEPMVGNDENPYRQPIPYLAQEAAGHIPAISAYQETPMGETFFPSASVGYSKVVVKSIHDQVGKTAKAVTEHRFYTAKDFPVVVKETRLEKYHNPSKGPGMSFPFGNQVQRSEFAASQGYSIVLNNMHGKPFSTVSYFLSEDNGREIKKINQGVEYKYHTKETKYGKMLKNEVDVLTREGYIENQLLGVEYDFAIDSRGSYESNKTSTYKTNYDVIPAVFGLPSLPLPTFFNNSTEDIKESRSVVTTKVIQAYGIVESVRSFSDQYETTVFNQLYDGQTGSVLLTETKDEYNANQFQYTNPAYLMSDMQRMGAASFNSGYQSEIESSNDSCYGGNGYINPGYLKHGDEVLITPGPSSSLTQPQKAWVNIEGKDPFIKTNCNDPKVFTAFTLWDWFSVNVYYDSSDPLYNVYNGNIKNHEQYDFCNSSLMWIGDIRNGAGQRKPRNQPRSFTGTKTGKMVSYHLKEQPANLIRDFYANYPSPVVSPSYDYSGVFGSVALYSDNATNSFCNTFAYDPNGNPTVFNRGRGHFVNSRINDITQHYIPGLFDMNDPIRFSVNDPRTFSGPCGEWYGDGYNSKIWELDHDPRLDKYLNRGQVWLTGYEVADALGNKSYDYFLDVVIMIGDIGSCNFRIKDASKVNTGNSNCPNSFQLINQSGNSIQGLTKEDRLKVVRSGNRNLLASNTGAIVSAKYPINIDANNKFIGIKGPNEGNQIFEAASVTYSDEYKMEDPYHTSSFIGNPFLLESDGNFQQQKAYKYLSSRHRKTTVENSKDGYLKEQPSLWKPKVSPCETFYMTPPEYFLDPNESSGWHLNEESTVFLNNGTAVESKNVLDIHSAIITTPTGQVELVASNTERNNIAVESFENYKHFDVGRPYYKHFGMLSNNSLSFLGQVGNVYYSDRVLVPAHDKILLDRVSHSGNHSIFLMGDYSGAYPLVLNYTENRQKTLVENALSNMPTTSGEQVSFPNQTSYNNAKNGHLGNFITSHWNYSPADIGTAFYNGQHQLSMAIDPANTQFGFTPESGTYLLSIWMKEPLASGTPYEGLSPEVKIITGSSTTTLKANSTAIDGWYKIEGEFSYLEPNTITIELDGGLWGAFYDDLRVHPVQSNVNTYVYDELSGRLKAKLDENNYATFYEYNEEGIPAQVKRETQRGVLTISESRQSIKKQ